MFLIFDNILLSRCFVFHRSFLGWMYLYMCVVLYSHVIVSNFCTEYPTYPAPSGVHNCCCSAQSPWTMIPILFHTEKAYESSNRKSKTHIVGAQHVSIPTFPDIPDVDRTDLYDGYNGCVFSHFDVIRLCCWYFLYGYVLVCNCNKIVIVTPYVPLLKLRSISETFKEGSEFRAHASD